jgi:hypothetical protein
VIIYPLTENLNGTSIKVNSIFRFVCVVKAITDDLREIFCLFSDNT